MKKNYEAPVMELLVSGETARYLAETPEDKFEDANA